MGKNGSKWRHGYIPLNAQAALLKAHGSHKGAAKFTAASHSTGLARVVQAAQDRHRRLESQPVTARVSVRAGIYNGQTGHHITGTDSRGRSVKVFAPGDRAAADQAAENIRAGRPAFTPSDQFRAAAHPRTPVPTPPSAPSEPPRPTYRERRQARAERLRGWAEKRQAKADASLNQAHQMGEAIPFGQPILVGHHSEGRDRRYRDRMHNAMDRGIEHQRKAGDMNARANGIESQLATSIYSDDPNAVPALEQRVAALEAERDRIKAYNATARKGKPDTSLLNESERKALLDALRYSPGAPTSGAFPSYHLSNLTGNIARQRKRLEELRRQNGGH